MEDHGKSKQIWKALRVFSWKEKTAAHREDAQPSHRTGVKQQWSSSSKRQGPTLVPGDFLLRPTGIHGPIPFG